MCGLEKLGIVDRTGWNAFVTQGYYHWGTRLTLLRLDVCLLIIH